MGVWRILVLLAVVGVAYCVPKSKKEKRVGDWHMVFRAQTGNRKSVIDAYLNPEGTNEYNALPGCTSVRPVRCHGHYRHSALDSWRTLGVKMVKIEFYKNGIPVAYVTFNGRGTDNVNWFDRRKVVSSSWTDVTINGNYFSLFGYKNKSLNRRFYINKSFGGCPKDVGWMIVLDNKGDCGFERSTKRYPVFLYSPHSTSTNLEKESAEADVMAIYIDY